MKYRRSVTPVALLATILLGGCANKGSTPAGAPPLLVPSAVTSGRTSDILAANSPTNDIVIPRYDRSVEGPYTVAQITTVNIYTYDAQPIGLHNGYGYRYRTENQGRITVP